MAIENLKCPKCKGPMAVRLNRRDGTSFWGCRAYPNCNGTRDNEGMSREERQLEKEAQEAQDSEKLGSEEWER